MGFPVEYVASYATPGSGNDYRWSRRLRGRLRAAIAEAEPDVVVFDGTHPYEALLGALPAGRDRGLVPAAAVEARLEPGAARPRRRLRRRARARRARRVRGPGPDRRAARPRPPGRPDRPARPRRAAAARARRRPSSGSTRRRRTCSSRSGRGRRCARRPRGRSRHLTGNEGVQVAALSSALAAAESRARGRGRAARDLPDEPLLRRLRRRGRRRRLQRLPRADRARGARRCSCRCSARPTTSRRGRGGRSRRGWGSGSRGPTIRSSRRSWTGCSSGARGDRVAFGSEGAERRGRRGGRLARGIGDFWSHTEPKLVNRARRGGLAGVPPAVGILHCSSPADGVATDEAAADQAPCQGAGPGDRHRGRRASTPFAPRSTRPGERPERTLVVTDALAALGELRALGVGVEHVPARGSRQAELAGVPYERVPRRRLELIRAERPKPRRVVVAPGGAPVP